MTSKNKVYIQAFNHAGDVVDTVTINLESHSDNMATIALCGQVETLTLGYWLDERDPIPCDEVQAGAERLGAVGNGRWRKYGWTWLAGDSVATETIDFSYEADADELYAGLDEYGRLLYVCNAKGNPANV